MTTQPTITIAVDASGDAARTVQAATALFGTDASYRFVHVAQSVPMTLPATAATPGVVGVAPTGVAGVEAERLLDPAEQIDSARVVAEQAAADAGMPDASAIGLAGDPATALIDDALECGAATIVVGAHDRGWLDRLLTTSVSKELQRNAPMPIVIVPAPQ
jgi:nucleotide-binding universal stress UspA family protein